MKTPRHREDTEAIQDHTYSPAIPSSSLVSLPCGSQSNFYKNRTQTINTFPLFLGQSPSAIMWLQTHHLKVDFFFVCLSFIFRPSLPSQSLSLSNFIHFLQCIISCHTSMFSHMQVPLCGILFSAFLCLSNT